MLVALQNTRLTNQKWILYSFLNEQKKTKIYEEFWLRKKVMLSYDCISLRLRNGYLKGPIYRGGEVVSEDTWSKTQESLPRS